MNPCTAQWWQSICWHRNWSLVCGGISWPKWALCQWAVGATATAKQLTLGPLIPHSGRTCSLTDLSFSKLFKCPVLWTNNNSIQHCGVQSLDCDHLSKWSLCLHILKEACAATFSRIVVIWHSFCKKLASMDALGGPCKTFNSSCRLLAGQLFRT